MEHTLSVQGKVQRINLTLSKMWFPAIIIFKDDHLRFLCNGLTFFSFEILDGGWLEITKSPSSFDSWKSPFKEWKIGDLITLIELHNKCEAMIALESLKTQEVS